MPTILSHAVAATAAGQWRSGRLPARFWTCTALCAMLPDIDVIAFSFGIAYEDMFGHRGFTHSFFFAALIGALVAFYMSHQSPPSNASQRMARFVWFGAVTASHGLLDALTTGGRGIAFFAPFSNHRYFFPWRPILVSPIGVGFFSARGLHVLVSEAGWIWLPSAIIAVAARRLRKRGT
jgi:inner membrane protein